MFTDLLRRMRDIATLQIVAANGRFLPVMISAYKTFSPASAFEIPIRQKLTQCGLMTISWAILLIDLKAAVR
jgi:hypothetical protein